MLQYQYYNSKLTKNHIEKILSNYNIKYNTMKNEIDAKFNNMIKLFINDIKDFLENIEEISNERKKIKEAEKFEVELVLLKNQLKEKNKTENQLRNELELLTKENESLKKKIQTNEQIIKNKAPNFDTNNNNSNNNERLKTEIKPTKNRYKKFTAGNNNILKNKTAKKNKEKSNININVALKSGEKRTINNYSHKSNNVISNFGKNTTDSDNLRYSNSYLKSMKRVNKSVDKKTILKKKKTNAKKNMNDIEKSLENKSNQDTKSSSKTQNFKNKSTLIDEKFNSVEMPSIEPHDNNESLTTDEVIEDEIKELELEEENIVLLIDKIKQLNQNI